jgi:hypothetical protein
LLLFHPYRGELDQGRTGIAGSGVEAALGFAEAGPASGASVFAGKNGAGAIGAADAGIIAIV